PASTKPQDALAPELPALEIATSSSSELTAQIATAAEPVAADEWIIDVTPPITFDRCSSPVEFATKTLKVAEPEVYKFSRAFWHLVATDAVLTTFKSTEWSREFWTLVDLPANNKTTSDRPAILAWNDSLWNAHANANDALPPHLAWADAACPINHPTTPLATANPWTDHAELTDVPLLHPDRVLSDGFTASDFKNHWSPSTPAPSGIISRRCSLGIDVRGSDTLPPPRRVPTGRLANFKILAGERRCGMGLGLGVGWSIPEPTKKPSPVLLTVLENSRGAVDADGGRKLSKARCKLGSECCLVTFALDFGEPAAENIEAVSISVDHAIQPAAASTAEHSAPAANQVSATTYQRRLLVLCRLWRVQMRGGDVRGLRIPPRGCGMGQQSRRIWKTFGEGGNLQSGMSMDAAVAKKHESASRLRGAWTIPRSYSVPALDE
ncbi:hypothetical protein HDU96_002570, partial [Phlyctochytrium bullatum]